MSNSDPMICCSADEKRPPRDLQEISARNAIQINPNNAPSSRLLIEVSKRWPSSGVNLTVDFIDSPKPSQRLRDKIVSYMNKWSQFCNVRFTQVTSNGRVRISLLESGFWSYMGTDIDLIAKNRPTMSLQDFSLDTPDSEYERVVLHEAGHALGFTHEHLRPEIVNGIDRKKAIEYFGAPPNNWPPEVTISNVLTPLDPNSYRGTLKADTDSIMCYSLPSVIMKPGFPTVTGGREFDCLDRECAAKLYPIPQKMSKYCLSEVGEVQFDKTIEIRNRVSDWAAYSEAHESAKA